MEAWRSVKEKHLCAMERRQEGLASHATTMRVLGGAGTEMIRAHQSDWDMRLAPVSSINWSKANAELRSLASPEQQMLEAAE